MIRPASQATEVIRKVVRKVVSKVVRRLIRKVISTCTTLRTTLLTRSLMTFDHGSAWFCREELATPPPADEGEIEGEAAPDPSLPTTGSRDRGSPLNKIQERGRSGQQPGWRQETGNTLVRGQVVSRAGWVCRFVSPWFSSFRATKDGASTSTTGRGPSSERKPIRR